MASVPDFALGVLGAAGRTLTGGARILLDMPAAGDMPRTWMDRRAWPQLRRLLERCREDLALMQATTPTNGARRLVATPSPFPPGRGRCCLAGVIDSSGELSALADVTRSEPSRGEWWLGLILVRPDVRGRGIGASTVEALETWARAEGGRAIFSAVQRRNVPALHFARRTGFVLRGETAGHEGKVDLLVVRDLA
jgi:GNAT superfamily N-acetyltransferase